MNRGKGKRQKRSLTSLVPVRLRGEQKNGAGDEAFGIRMIVEGVVAARLNNGMRVRMVEAFFTFNRDSHDAGMDKNEYGLVFVPVIRLDSRTGLPNGFDAVRGLRIVGEELMGAFAVFCLDYVGAGLGSLWRSAGKEREHACVGW